MERCLIAPFISLMPIFSSSINKRSGLFGRMLDSFRRFQICSSRSSLFLLTKIFGCIMFFSLDPASGVPLSETVHRTLSASDLPRCAQSGGMTSIISLDYTAFDPVDMI